MAVNLSIPSLGAMFQDYRDPILGDSYSFGPTINANEIKYLAFHHSVTAQTAKNDGNWKAECDKIAWLHVNGNGWAGVGYRFIICSDGTVAYVGDLSHGGAAVTGNNHQIFSACLVGDFTKVLPTAAQIHSAYLLAKHFIDAMPQYPLLDSWDDIIGHRDASELLHLPGATATTCPSPVWRSGGDTLRDRIVNDRYAGYPNPQPMWSIVSPVPTSAPVPVPITTPVVSITPTVITEPTQRILVNGRELELRQVNDLMKSLAQQVQDLTKERDAQKPFVDRDAKMLTFVKTLYGI